MSLAPEIYYKKSPKELRAEFEEKWTKEDEEWAARRERCRCHVPRPGPRYFGVVRCGACRQVVQW